MNKYLFCLSLIFFNLSSFAGMLISHDGEIYHTELKPQWSSDVSSKADLDKIQFLTIIKTGDLLVFNSNTPVASPDYNFLTKPGPTKVPKLEGCGEHPFEWLEKSKIIAKLIAPEDKKKILVQIPANAILKSAYPEDLPEALAKILSKELDRTFTNQQIITKLKSSKILASGEKYYAYVIIEGDLNQSLYVLEKMDKGSRWNLGQMITLTDECP